MNRLFTLITFVSCSSCFAQFYPNTFINSAISCGGQNSNYTITLNQRICTNDHISIQPNGSYYTAFATNGVDMGTSLTRTNTIIGWQKSQTYHAVNQCDVFGRRNLGGYYELLRAFNNGPGVVLQVYNGSYPNVTLNSSETNCWMCLIGVLNPPSNMVFYTSGTNNYGQMTNPGSALPDMTGYPWAFCGKLQSGNAFYGADISVIGGILSSAWCRQVTAGYGTAAKAPPLPQGNIQQ